MTDRPPAAVFLSYASQDAEAARRICEALRATGIEVWFDQNELVGGDAWDQKIRGQVKSCALFVPVISANTQARLEGYFRLEWKLAAQRTHTMADAKPFLLPIVIDATGDAEAHVPEEFRAVQWTRLPGGETSEKFCARAQNLLGGAVAGVADPGRSAQTTPASARPATIKPSRSWLVTALIAATAVALALWQPWKKSAPASASLTEAQQLVAKARKIFDEGDELNRETYTLAEELLKKAETLDVSEASAWALHTRISANFYNLGWDVTSTRREAILMQAGRAAKLAPGTLEADLAGAIARVALDQNRPEVQEQLRQLARAHPTDIQVLRQLVRAYGFDGKSQEAVETVQQALKLAPDDPALKADLVNYLRVNNRFAEADAAVVSGLKGRVNARLLVFETWLRLYWREDTAGAVATVAKWPAWLLVEDRGAALAACAHLWRGDSARAIQVLQALPGDEVRDSFLAGPRTAFIALAHEQAGQAESAAASWRIALQVAQRRLASAPDDIVALHWQAWAQARLGDTPAAIRGFRLLRERSPLPSSLYIFGGLAGLALATGQRDEALALLGPTPYSGVPTPREPTKAILRINRVFDPLRNDPRFQALIDAAPAPEDKKENK